MVFGYARIPIVKWMRDQATEGMNHAAMAGEHVTTLGRHPSLKIGKYYALLTKVEGRNVWLEEYAREQIQLEEGHIADVEKMLRRPGDLKPAR